VLNSPSDPLQYRFIPFWLIQVGSVIRKSGTKSPPFENHSPNKNLTILIVLIELPYRFTEFTVQTKSRIVTSESRHG
jgi:hypothetical protein